MVADVGQGDDVEAVVEKAYKTGASKVVVEDLREEFLIGYVWPALKAGAVYENKYLLGTSLARPVIAKHQVEVALREGASAVSHGCTGKGNDQVRFEMAYQALAPELKVIAPWREWDLKSREDCLDYAEKRGISVTASREKIHSRDRNLWHLSHEGGELEDAANAPFASTWQMTRSPQEAPNKDEQVEIGFEKGVPVSVAGQTLDPVSLLELLNEIGGRNAIGRVDLVENRFVGIKSRGCYETPGGTLLLAAHGELEALCLDRDLLHFKQHVALKYAELVYFGLWFTPLREALDAFVDTTQQNITGSVALSLYKGNVSVVSRKSPHSLYRTDLSSFTMGARYDQKDAEGFIRILGLPSRCRAALEQNRSRRRRRRSRLLMKMWSGRFRKPLDPEFEKWQRSFRYDQRLLPFELAASRAHARALEHSGVLSSEDLSEILDGLNKIARLAESPEFLNDPEAEDVHHFVEKKLAALIGATGYKLHAGRSRNEQIATDLRLFVRVAIDDLQDLLADWIEAILARAESAGTAAMPGFTHLQPAEPVLVAHWLLAYVEMFLRDSERLASCRKRVESLSAWIGRDCRSYAGARPARDCGRAWLRRHHRQQHGCDQRPRFRPRIRAGSGADVAASEPMGGRDDSVFDLRLTILSRCPKLIRPDRARCRRKRIPTCWNWCAEKRRGLLDVRLHCKLPSKGYRSLTTKICRRRRSRCSMRPTRC